MFPLVLFVLRLRIKEPAAATRNSMRHAKTPYLLALRFYGLRLFVVSLIWFLYDVRFFIFYLFIPARPLPGPSLALAVPP